MSQPLQPRRSARTTEPRRHLADEQAWRRQRELEAAEIARAIREAEATVEPSDSDEHELADGECSDSEHDEKAHPASENTPPWTQRLSDVHYPIYISTPIVQLPRHRPSTELGFLQCYLDHALITTIVANTNQYSQARQAVGWVDVTTEEMWRYLAVRIRQDIVVLPDLHHYWADEYRDRYCSQMMTRNRFLQLHRYFHIAPPVDRDARQTVVEKTAPFYHQCQRLFKQYYIPGRDFALDETMIRFQGRSAWITVIKGKPVPVGYKLYTVASDGYLLDFRIFRGKGGYNTPHSVLHNTVMDLVDPWKGEHRRLYFDNLYTFSALCDAWLQKSIQSCGTCRTNRRALPPNLKQERGRLGKGELKAWQRGHIGCLLWNDARPVVFLSTHRRIDSLSVIPAASGRPATTRPSVAVDYNYNKGHVDQVDQLRSYYVVQRRGRRTWPALAWWLLDMCISNAYKLWCVETSANVELLHFREQLLRQIAAAYPSPRTPVQPGVPPASHTHTVGHFLEQLHGSRKCKQCSRGRAGGARTQFACDVCRVRLCPAPCFKQ